MSLILNGIGISRGIGIGTVHILDRGNHKIIQYNITKEYVKDEVVRFKKAHKQAIAHLHDVRKSIPKNAPGDTAAIIDSHLLMLSDEMLSKTPIQIIKAQQYNAEWALKHQKDALVKVFDNMSDDYLKTRRSDIEHIVHIILSCLSDESYGSKKARHLKGQIIVTDDLTPSDTILFEQQKIGGFITEYGGPTSHTAIIARGLGIPSIVAMANATTLLQEGETIIMDSAEGVVLAKPSRAVLSEHRERQKFEKEQKKNLAQLKNKIAKSSDGVRISLMANIELNEEIRMLKQSGSDGVGLYRTEFLYLDQSLASEEEQFQTYKKIIRAADNKPVTIRTLDLGAEKEFDPNYKGPMALNPALGLRGIRRSLKFPKDLLSQLRAIFRASAYGKVRILIPMLTNAQEIKQVLSLCEHAKHQLTEKKRKYGNHIQIGGMIEIPAAALAAEELGKGLDFLSIGTNDLIQYTLAVDRIDEEVSYLYDPLHPSILKLIETVIVAGEKLKIPVAMCGEMAGDLRLTRLLLAMGLKEFSVHPSNLPEIKSIIMGSNVKALKRQYKRLSASGDSQQIMKLVS